MLSSAAPYRSSGLGPQHNLSLSLDGGMAIGTPQSSNSPITQLPRAAAGASLNYELQNRALMAGIGVGFGFIQTATRLSDYRDSYNRTTRDGDDILYHYVFTSYQETRTQLQVRVPIYIGATFLHSSLSTKHSALSMYALAGATLGVNVASDYHTQASMYTAAEYQHLPGVIVGNLPNYGYGIYPEYNYQTKASTLSASIPARMSVSPMVELGANIQFTDQIRLRIGLFAAYQWMVSPEQISEPLLDLTKVNLSPYTQSQSDLAENLRLAPLSHTPLLPGSGMNNLMVGLRITLQLRFKATPICMCTN